MLLQEKLCSSGLEGLWDLVIYCKCLVWFAIVRVHAVICWQKLDPVSGEDEHFLRSVLSLSNFTISATLKKTKTQADHIPRLSETVCVFLLEPSVAKINTIVIRSTSEQLLLECVVKSLQSFSTLLTRVKLEY